MTIRELRAALGWTQQKLADKLDVSRRSVIRWEMGKSQPMKVYAKSIAALQKKHIAKVAS